MKSMFILSSKLLKLENVFFVRFCVITPLFCSLGKALQAVAGGPCALPELFTRNVDEFPQAELRIFAEKLRNVQDGAIWKYPIGEAMLQFHSKA